MHLVHLLQQEVALCRTEAVVVLLRHFYYELGGERTEHDCLDQGDVDGPFDWTTHPGEQVLVQVQVEQSLVGQQQGPLLGLVHVVVLDHFQRHQDLLSFYQTPTHPPFVADQHEIGRFVLGIDQTLHWII